VGKFLYLLIVQLSLFCLGVSAFTIGALIIRRPPRWYGYALTKLGAFAVVGVIMLLILPNQVVEWRPQTGVYIGGIIMYTVGVMVVCRDILVRTAQGRVTERSLRFSALEEGDVTSNARLADLEARTTAEEARNTDIEQFAEETRAHAEEHGQSQAPEHGKTSE
jgi:hypothetical protein